MQQPDPNTEIPPAIVVIDDDASMRKALENLFKSVGFDVELYASPQDFLQSQRPDRPGCIVLDVQGRFGWAHNSSDMPCAVMISDADGPRVWLNKAEAGSARDGTTRYV